MKFFLFRALSSLPPPPPLKKKHFYFQLLKLLQKVTIHKQTTEKRKRLEGGREREEEEREESERGGFSILSLSLSHCIQTLYYFSFKRGASPSRAHARFFRALFCPRRHGDELFRGPQPLSAPARGRGEPPGAPPARARGIMTTAAGEVSANLATSGRRHPRWTRPARPSQGGRQDSRCAIGRERPRERGFKGRRG